MKSFDDVFGGVPLATGAAPGRVNLLGEHTDYNDGYVLPVAIGQRTRVAVRPNHAGRFRLYAAALEAVSTFGPGEAPPEQFARYVQGCVAVTEEVGFDVPPLDIHVTSNVPIGVGLSSSAALEVATLRALRELLALPFDDVRIAQLAQRAEIEHAGVRCGIMDQMAASLADPTRALFLDTRTLARRLVPLPPESAVLVLDSGVARELAGSGYNTRRAECEEAARQLGVSALRDVGVDDLVRVAALPEPLRRRARHVVTENQRVLDAVRGVDAARFGALMNASHASLRDDYEVSVPALDRLVALLQATSEVHGARLTGAGFGGACVALCASGSVDRVAARVLRDYEQQGGRGRLLVPAADAGDATTGHDPPRALE
ncbi:MAG TPA: galactokinase [Burkholderiaceae bacterium]|nr:galactokinase [Burkholderiaceae bacterium]